MGKEKLTTAEAAKAAYEQPAKESEERLAQEKLVADEKLAKKEAAEKLAQEKAAKAEKAECMYCGEIVAADEAFTDKDGKTFCSEEHAQTYAQTMKQIHQNY